MSAEDADSETPEEKHAAPTVKPRSSGIGNVLFVLIGAPIAFYGIRDSLEIVATFAQFSRFLDLPWLANRMLFPASTGGAGILIILYGLRRSPFVLRLLLAAVGIWLVVFVLILLRVL